MRTFNDNNAVRMAATPATWAAAAVYGNWIAVAGFRRFTFIPMNTELDGALLVEVFQATSSVGAGAAAVTGLSNTFANGTDEARVGIIEVRDSDLLATTTHIALKVTPAATDSFGAVCILSEPYEAPVLNGTTQGVAWVTGE